jgi:hypothetical protein
MENSSYECRWNNPDLNDAEKVPNGRLSEKYQIKKVDNKHWLIGIMVWAD